MTRSAVESFGRLPTPRSAELKFVDVALEPLPATPIDAHQYFIGLSSFSDSLKILNFGALGFGPVSANTIRAIGVAAKSVGCLQNTGEDGLTGIHLERRTPLIWQIGTGYFGCRDEHGGFDLNKFAEIASATLVAAVELKLSQGAKPGAGGLLPAAKNNRHVARILDVQPHTDVVSPPRHSAFETLPQMLTFIDNLRTTINKPVGVKLCLGSRAAAHRLITAISSTGIIPTFIHVDSGEGGSGAANYEAQQFAGLPIDTAIRILDQELRLAQIRNELLLFASGRITNGYDLFRLLCKGADACFFVRAPLIAMGCIQVRRCHIGDCPTGLAAQDPWRRPAIDPDAQGTQLANYYRTVIDSFEVLLRASGRQSAATLDSTCLVDVRGETDQDDLTLDPRKVT